MTDQEKNELSQKIVQVVQSHQTDSDPWVDFARIGALLADVGIQYKPFGFQKLRSFLNEFEDVLLFKEEHPADGRPPVCYVKVKTTDSNSGSVLSTSNFTNAQPVARRIGEKIPSEESRLFRWATVPSSMVKKLAEMALDEKWYYGNELTKEQEHLPMLRNYLTYTFHRLCTEGKVLVEIDVDRNEEYAAFNTGLVDDKYEYIYALFKPNTQYPNYYWYLWDFVVAGEDKGKTLVKIFNPLPEKADYFENKIQNMLYDTSTGNLSCDYPHIITERTERLPVDFLKENCTADFLSIDGVDIDDICDKSSKEKKEYYEALGAKISNNPRVLNRLKNRIEDAVKLALKRVEWNYKTAIPMYFPAKKTCSLLLPLSLCDEGEVDLALVVTRHRSGSYQGETVLPLHLAYSNSRLVTRPDSDWLKTDIISIDPDDEEDDQQFEKESNM